MLQAAGIASQQLTHWGGLILTGLGDLVNGFIKDPTAGQKMDETISKLAPYQGILGIIQLGLEMSNSIENLLPSLQLSAYEGGFGAGPGHGPPAAFPTASTSVFHFAAASAFPTPS